MVSFIMEKVIMTVQPAKVFSTTSKNPMGRRLPLGSLQHSKFMRLQRPKG